MTDRANHISRKHPGFHQTSGCNQAKFSWLEVEDPAPTSTKPTVTFQRQQMRVMAATSCAFQLEGSPICLSTTWIIPDLRQVDMANSPTGPLSQHVGPAIVRGIAVINRTPAGNRRFYPDFFGRRHKLYMHV